MSVLMYSLKGTRGRSIKIYDRKVEIKVEAAAGSLITDHAADGEKTVYYTDVIGLQYKEPGKTTGYLHFETANGQMNNEQTGFWSENSFTFTEKEVGKARMREVVEYVKDTLETIKYGSISSKEEVSDNIEKDTNPSESEWYFMSGYEKVWTETYDAPNSRVPVHIEASALLKNTETSDYIVLVKLQNNSKFNVNKVKIEITLKDADNKMIGDKIIYVFKGPTITPFTSFGTDEVIPLPDVKGISSYQVTVKQVLFSNGLEWTNVFKR